MASYRGPYGTGYVRHQGPTYITINGYDTCVIQLRQCALGSSEVNVTQAAERVFPPAAHNPGPPSDYVPVYNSSSGQPPSDPFAVTHHDPDREAAGIEPSNNTNQTGQSSSAVDPGPVAREDDVQAGQTTTTVDPGPDSDANINDACSPSRPNPYPTPESMPDESGRPFHLPSPESDIHPSEPVKEDPPSETQPVGNAQQPRSTIQERHQVQPAPLRQAEQPWLSSAGQDQYPQPLQFTQGQQFQPQSVRQERQSQSSQGTQGQQQPRPSARRQQRRTLILPTNRSLQARSLAVRRGRQQTRNERPYEANTSRLRSPIALPELNSTNARNDNNTPALSRNGIYDNVRNNSPTRHRRSGHVRNQSQHYILPIVPTNQRRDLPRHVPTPHQYETTQSARFSQYTQQRQTIRSTQTIQQAGSIRQIQTIQQTQSTQQTQLMHPMPRRQSMPPSLLLDQPQAQRRMPQSSFVPSITSPLLPFPTLEGLNSTSTLPGSTDNTHLQRVRGPILGQQPLSLQDLRQDQEPLQFPDYTEVQHPGDLQQSSHEQESSLESGLLQQPQGLQRSPEDTYVPQALQPSVPVESDNVQPAQSNEIYTAIPVDTVVVPTSESLTDSDSTAFNINMVHLDEIPIFMPSLPFFSGQTPPSLVQKDISERLQQVLPSFPSLKLTHREKIVFPSVSKSCSCTFYYF